MTDNTESAQSDQAPPTDQPDQAPPTLDDVQNSKDEGAFWSHYTNMRSRMGNSLSIPSDDASAEVKNAFLQKVMNKVPDLVLKPGDDPDSQQAFYSMIGRPESADKYVVPELELPDGIDMPEEIAKSMQEVAHKHGLTQKQFEGVFSELITKEAAQAAERLSAQAEQAEQLKKDWGYAYDVNVKKALSAAHKTGAPESIVNMLQDGAASPEMMRYFHGLSSVVGAEPSQLNDMAGGSSAIDPATARERISEIMNNKQHAYWNAADPAHSQAKQRVNELYKLANPDSKILSVLGA